jgi:hypothetical protein
VQLHVLDQHAPQAYQLPLAQRRLVVVCVVKCGGGGGDGVWVGCRRGA